jgi:gamma-glutamyl-gamma-aminobutyrate hydrolase PuuD
MKIIQRVIKEYDNNPGYHYTGLRSGYTSFFIHKKGVVAILLPSYGKFWLNTKEALIEFILDGVMYTGGIDKINNERSLGLRIDRFVKECIKLSNQKQLAS